MNIIPLHKLLTEIIDNHADPDSPDYNGCDKDPCAWCLSAMNHLNDLDGCDQLKAEVERLRHQTHAAESAYLDSIFQTAERCAQIADEYASVEGTAQRISTTIRNEFLPGDPAYMK